MIIFIKIIKKKRLKDDTYLEKGQVKTNLKILRRFSNPVRKDTICGRTSDVQPKEI